MGKKKHQTDKIENKKHNKSKECQKKSMARCRSFAWCSRVIFVARHYEVKDSVVTHCVVRHCVVRHFVANHAVNHGEKHCEARPCGGNETMTANAVGKGKCRGAPTAFTQGRSHSIPETWQTISTADGVENQLGKKQNISQCDLIFQHSLKRQPSFSCMLVTFFHAGEENPQKRNTCHRHPPQINISP